MALQTLDLWTLTRGRPQIDPNDLAEAIAVQASEVDLDYRTRLLIRDSVAALKLHWGTVKWQQWLAECPHKGRIDAICGEEFDKVGFPSLERRLMEKTDPELIRKFLDHLGRKLRESTRIYIAGSGALILLGLLVRHTEDIDVVDEVPKEIRDNHQLLQELQADYGLHLGHVQSHYFPSGWQNRAQSFDLFGRLSVYLVDAYDVFLSKLFSSRVKDMGDMRMLTPQLDKETLVQRFKGTCGSLLAAPRLNEIAQDNWHVLFGEDLPQ